MIGDCGLTLHNIEGKMLPEIGYHISENKITHVSVIFREETTVA